jgi:hypothetical protein
MLLVLSYLAEEAVAIPVHKPTLSHKIRLAPNGHQQTYLKKAFYERESQEKTSPIATTPNVSWLSSPLYQFNRWRTERYRPAHFIVALGVAL